MNTAYNSSIPIAGHFDFLPLVCLLASLVMVAILNTLFSKKMRVQFEGFFNARYVNQILREESTSGNPASALLLINAIVVTALAIYNLIQFTGDIKPNNWLLFSSILGGIAAVLLYFLIIPDMVRFLFNQDRGLSEHRYNFLLIFQVTGLFLLPLTIIAAYSSVGGKFSAYAAIVLLAVVYCYRLVRGIMIGMSNRVSWIYIILYLCTLEILPLVLIVGLMGGFHG